MELFRIKRDIPFMSYGRLTTTISLVTFILAVFFLATRGLNYSVEFTGGTVLEVQYQQSADLGAIRDKVDELKLGESTVQSLGSSRDVMIRLPNKPGVTSAQLSEKVMGMLKASDSAVQLRKVDFVGPSVGEELVTHGLTATILVCVGIMIYLAIRFEWRFAIAAIIANMHDVVIILGCFAFFRWEFSLTVLAGILAVLGYSVNESVVVFDRIRENFRKPGMKGHSVAEVIDNAITATMSRTIITHFSTEMMVVSMLLFGGPALHGFAMALTIGIVFGIYSSVLVASPIALWLGVKREHMIKPVKPKEEAVV
ncbi:MULTISPECIES: protein translocase subunit SecF [Chromobacterium]|uniref:Protein-export membrane protein SecF n=1 Tax=Chromobacterium haemolyticum TaxID=394935 RepID=A0A1W0CMR2_9NEIS|nr:MULTISPECIES: protein translocase subunit SecF [Chromobacterium]MDH0340673.1 protein translocase subunit SecF [Chromobacterium haemolyticum]OQS36104.1 protein-export membrane protein SecF [Chromobacterium haemolyticum]QOZ84895.1 protein translocase subunit SecF [Chromobacterium sp. Rain0013]UGA38596.1 protein translocase subunit SecF [Chromobacterium haemolyticum]WON85098.1 protein translocase subunit SecF [Chromobacterium haemolyticum]